jgi:hypothetical protein
MMFCLVRVECLFEFPGITMINEARKLQSGKYFKIVSNLSYINAP